MKIPRSRQTVSLAIVVTVGLGLLTRADLPWPELIARYGGDTLYATLIYLLLVWVWLQAPSRWLALAAWGICVAVELSQLVHTPWLDALRATLLGRLVLGAGFLWSDLLCYALGALLGHLLLPHRGHSA